ncbi:phosphoribosyltransferase [Bacillus cereus]|uniref:phosphoribosyltransferase n=1 Tax=Bacillus cereus TaxID=1396 RepID=UPI001E4CD1F0|nr:phosphoribosyltransferase [Bacillus cereus]MCC2458312.1 phosphoribosyltransferase [Bacillus cereus]
MSKIVLFPSDSIKGSDNKVYAGIGELLEKLNADGDVVVFLSHDAQKLQALKEEYPFAYTIRRGNIKSLVEKAGSGYVVLVGSHDQDLYTAVQNKMLLINPLWSNVQEEKAVKYGIGINSPENLYEAIKIFNNQKAWFYELDIDDKTKLYSLTRANDKLWTQTQSEKEVVQGFRAVLKHGNREYFEVLLYHFLASIINNEEFKEVDIWAIMPSSGTTLNEDMMYFKERVRYLMNKRMNTPLFVRHTAAAKSHYMTRQEDRLYCRRHFDTIKIDPYYRRKLKGKTVCILDDYVTNGTSFEALRNLLMQQGVEKVIFVSLGRFFRANGIEYYKQDYEITGNVFDDNYNYQLVNEGDIKGKFNSQAVEDIKELYKIIYS